MLSIRRRVRLLAFDSDVVVRDLHREEVSSMLDEGTAAAAETRNGFVTAVRLTGKRLQSTARPGSFGIRHEPCATAKTGWIYQHRDVYGRKAA